MQSKKNNIYSDHKFICFIKKTIFTVIINSSVSLSKHKEEIVGSCYRGEGGGVKHNEYGKW